MSSAADAPTISFPEDFGAREEWEMASRGYFSDVTVNLANGRRYKLVFMDITRLQQTLEDDVRLGRPYFTEPGLVILPEVTREAIRRAVVGLHRDGYFKHLKPLELAEHQADPGN